MQLKYLNWTLFEELLIVYTLQNYHSLSGKVLDGYIPNKQKKLVDAWMAIHEEELKAAWYSYNEDGEIIKIKGLEWFKWDLEL